MYKGGVKVGGIGSIKQDPYMKVIKKLANRNEKNNNKNKAPLEFFHDIIGLPNNNFGEKNNQ